MIVIDTDMPNSCPECILRHDCSIYQIRDCEPMDDEDCIIKGVIAPSDYKKLKEKYEFFEEFIQSFRALRGDN